MTDAALTVEAPFTFRPITRADFAMLQRWLRTPHVARWWADDSSDEGLEEMYGVCIDGTEPCEVFIADRAGRAIGLAQRYRVDAYSAYRNEVAALTDVPAGTSSIDYLIGPEDAIRRGWGTELIRALAARLWQDDPETPAIMVPSHTANRASWRTLERAGFRRVAAGHITPDNPIDTPEHFIYRLDRPLRTG